MSMPFASQTVVVQFVIQGIYSKDFDVALSFYYALDLSISIPFFKALNRSELSKRNKVSE